MYINCHTHQNSMQANTLSLVNLPMGGEPNHVADRFYSVGIHPWQAADADQEHLTKLSENLSHKRVIALGECGLDKHKGPAMALQTMVFKAQIELSESFELPLIIHCVKAYSELFKIKKDMEARQAWLLHGFNASLEVMTQALKHNCFFSLGKTLLQAKSKAARVLPAIPRNRLFLETDDDAADLLPELYATAAGILKTDVAQLQSEISTNFKQLFNVNHLFS